VRALLGGPGFLAVVLAWEIREGRPTILGRPTVFGVQCA
jgi:hypothetical protein